MATSTYKTPTHAAMSAVDINTPHGDEAMQTLIKANGGQPLAPEMIPDSIRKMYQDQASEQLHPWFQNEQNYGAAKLSNATGQNEVDYQNTIDQLNEGLKTSVQDLSNKEGESGTWGGSARTERANSLAAQYNNKYRSAYNSASGNAANILTANEYNYGNTGNQPNITQYGVNNNNGVINPTSSGVAKYNPFGGQGLLQNNMDSYSQQLGSDYLQAGNKIPVPSNFIKSKLK